MRLRLLALMGIVQIAWSLPQSPQDPEHPSSQLYNFQVKIENWTENKRKMTLYLPLSRITQTELIPLVVFGHGQALDVPAYASTFEHLAGKGIAVLHPQYDTGFFDRNWRRMSGDFNILTLATLKKFPQLDGKKVIYAGHSKGGYMALMAAGHPNHRELPYGIQSLILFSPAGLDAEYLKALSPQLPVTLIYPEQDQIIKRELIDQIYAGLPTNFKQLILVRSYPELKAEHFFLLNKSYIFGGRDGLSPLHYYGSWKWLMGAVLDVVEGGKQKNIYLYGDEALDTGVDGLKHACIKRN